PERRTHPLRPYQGLREDDPDERIRGDPPGTLRQLGRQEVVPEDADPVGEGEQKQERAEFHGAHLLSGVGRLPSWEAANLPDTGYILTLLRPAASPWSGMMRARRRGTP